MLYSEIWNKSQISYNPCHFVDRQGIDKNRLNERAPQLMRTIPGARKNSFGAGRPESMQGSSNSHAYRPVRTKSLRLLDEHLNSMSASQPRGNYQQPRPANIIPVGYSSIQELMNNQDVELYLHMLQKDSVHVSIKGTNQNAMFCEFDSGIQLYLDGRLQKREIQSSS